MKGLKRENAAGGVHSVGNGGLPWEQNVAIPKDGCLSTVLDEVDRGTKRPTKWTQSPSQHSDVYQGRQKMKHKAGQPLSSALSSTQVQSIQQPKWELRQTSPAPAAGGQLLTLLVCRDIPRAGRCCPLWQRSSLGWWPCCSSRRHTALDPIYKNKKPKKHELTLPPFP